MKMNSDLLNKYVAGHINDEEKKEVVEWIQQSEDHMREYLRLKKITDISLMYGPLYDVEEKKASVVFFKRLAYISTIAAALLLLVATAVFLKSYSGLDEVQTLYVPSGQRGELQLADGTYVWLNSNSRITFPTKFKSKERKVKLDGEAYFSVTRNPKQPFIVDTDKYDVKVLGTEFNVNAYSKTEFWETALLNGKVEILDGQEMDQSYPVLEKNVVLTPGRRLVLEHGHLFQTGFDSETYYLSRNGIMSFKNKSILEILEVLEIRRNLDIKIQCPEKLQCKYSGKFRNEDRMETILKLLSVGNDFSYRINEEESEIIIF